MKFQYILCYGSTVLTVPNVCGVDISIHPMLRFNYLINNNFVGAKKFQYILCYGSTKRRSGQRNFVQNFNTSYVTVQPQARRQNHRAQAKFQYILCYGSTWEIFFQDMLKRYFNTSYVTVQHICNSQGKWKLLISIHPMLRFNLLLLIVFVKKYKFQYILCYGSTRNKAVLDLYNQIISIHPMLRFNTLQRTFQQLK